MSEIQSEGNYFYETKKVDIDDGHHFIEYFYFQNIYHNFPNEKILSDFKSLKSLVQESLEAV